MSAGHHRNGEITDLAMCAMGIDGVLHDDNPVLSCLDALADDMQTLVFSLDSAESDPADTVHRVDAALHRLIFRVGAIRRMVGSKPVVESADAH